MVKFFILITAEEAKFLTTHYEVVRSQIRTLVSILMQKKLTKPNFSVLSNCITNLITSGKYIIYLDISFTH